jgi:hypothetical protein
MRFKRSDLPGFLIAVGAPALLLLVFLRTFEVWDHRGTPLLGFIAVNIAVAVGLMAMFTRFVRNWDGPVACLLLLAAAVGGVLWAQGSGNDGTAFATAMKWMALASFLLLNAVIGLQVLINGLLPILDRRDARRRART